MMDNETRWKAAAWLLWIGILAILVMGIVQDQAEIQQDLACKSFIGPLTPPSNPGGQAAPGSSQGPSDTSVPTPVKTETLALIPRTAWSKRAGIDVSSSGEVSHWAGLLGASWYLDWAVRPKPVTQPEHWQMVRVAPGCSLPTARVIRQTAHHYPGQVWIIGNEPDVIWQDNLTPEQYARQYHDLYSLIKSADPSARVAVGAISQATPLRLAYLDRMLGAYKKEYQTELPADLWTVHGFILREEAGSWGVSIPPGMNGLAGQLYEVSDHGMVDLFQDQIRAFRTWMAANGYRNIPLALTEFGILMPAGYGFPPQVVGQYLRDTFRWLDTAIDAQIGYPADDNRLVQRWSWFALSDPIYPNSNLADVEGEALTEAGEAFREFVIHKNSTTETTEK